MNEMKKKLTKKEKLNLKDLRRNIETACEESDFYRENYEEMQSEHKELTGKEWIW